MSLGTQNFNNEYQIGGGAWGTVYVGTLPAPLGRVAIKRLHSTGVPGDPAAQFRSEVETLSQLSHTNLLPLLGFSVDGPSLCLVYQFMQNGSLQDRLATQVSLHFVIMTFLKLFIIDKVRCFIFNRHLYHIL